jgi:predicted kinase
LPDVACDWSTVTGPAASRLRTASAHRCDSRAVPAWRLRQVSATGIMRVVSIVVLTGGPGAGKSTVAQAVAPLRRRCAVIEVDDVRQMLVHPHAAPWDGAEGLRQQELGVANAAQLAIAFAEDGADVVIADVVTNQTAALYRRALGTYGVQIVHLLVTEAMARDRAAGRHYSLTDGQMHALHAAQVDFVDFDAQLDTSVIAVSDAALQVCEILDETRSRRA